jgi:hypothetical protein
VSSAPPAADEAQLGWEARAGRPAAIAAAVAAVLAFAALPLKAGLVAGEDIDEQLLSIQGREGRYLAAHVADAVSALFLVGVVIYLYRCTKARRPELLPAALPLGIGGCIAFAVARVGMAVTFIDLSDQFARSRIPSNVSQISDPRDYLAAVDPVERAKRLADSSNAELFSIIALAGLLALGFALLLLSLNAMRAGLLSRFMGVLGIVLSVLFVLGGGPPPVIYAFWLAALAALFFNRWPGGRGPAWETGLPVPWPSAAALRDAGAAPEDDGRAQERAEEPPRRTSRKRKRRR